MIRALGVLAVLSVSGCAAQRIQSVRERFSSQAHCPMAQVEAREEGTGWRAWGCSQIGLCASDAALCEIRENGLMAGTTARKTFEREMKCSDPAVNSHHVRRGWLIQGCGHALLCGTPRGPCESVAAPTCIALAQEKLELCLEQDREGRLSCQAWFDEETKACSTAAP